MIQLATRGEVPDLEAERATRALAAVLDRRGIEQAATARLTRVRGPVGPLVIQVNLRLADSDVRMQCAGPANSVVPLAAGRLDRQVYRIATGAGPRWWFEAGRPALAGSSETVPITRRKQCRWQVCDPRSAVTLMDRMDYDAYVFTDSGSGEDSIVYRAGLAGVRLARQYGTYAPPVSDGPPLTIDPRRTRTLAEADATALLCERGLPFLFYTDPADGRGRLLYRRYDSRLTLIVATT
ncbi:sigma 54 modulation/S30EA ribosomal C-terminal domain-containing protein [Nocardia jejuensis]|uniref:sigma 54 modulation/S30EA ribosomal C-terminal domain-containing protein n=1 Tax=Nocardia jejuensis TaxID=328049 RepID=UPI000832E641|nr:sigma 54 modulation/S30EA ribosomal C-terminal domain-containing protein [Nocardia jejuensis]